MYKAVLNQGVPLPPSPTCEREAAMDDPRERDALVSEVGSAMFGLSNKKSEGDPESPSQWKPPGALWRNFHLCPHCQENGRRGLFERLNPILPIISRSDGVSYHLVMGDK